MQTLPPIIYVGEEAVSEANRHLDATEFLSRLRAACERGLHRTRGSTLKTLRGPWHGRAFRLRWGSWRAPMSWVPGSNGHDLVFVHQVGQRADIYDSHAFRERLDHFHDAIWSEREQRLLREPGSAGFTRAETLCPDFDSGIADDIAAEPLLSADQHDLFRAMLPFPKDWGAGDAVVILGKGPPGSGKTILAIQAAQDAVDSGRYSVLVLVPSPRLRRVFEQELRRVGIAADNFLAGNGAVSVLETQRFLAAHAGVALVGNEREAALDRWWDDLLGATFLRPWAAKHPEVRSLRFRRLLDAALEDSAGLGANPKDGLDAHDLPLYRLILEFTEHEKWMESARSDRAAAGFKLRSEIAQAALASLVADTAASGNLLVLVDEAQDLIPAECSALLNWCVARRRREPSTRFAFFGDENQRVSPTSFSWKELRAYAAAAFGTPAAPVTEIELPGSFRLSSKVALLANGLFDEHVTEKRKVKEVAKATPELLPDHGVVEIVVIPEPRQSVAKLLSALEGEGTEGTRLQLIALEPPLLPPPADGAAESRLDILEPRLAKGLEFPNLTVVEPLGGSSHRLSYDRVTVAYTALTRAMDRLLCIISPDEWKLAGKRWARDGFEPVFLDATANGRKQLKARLLAMMGAVDISQQARLLENQLRDRLEKAGSIHVQERFTEELAQLMSLAGRLVRLGKVDSLADEFLGALQRDVFGRLARERLADPGVRWEDSVGLLLLLGEIAAALELFERNTDGDEAEADLRVSLKEADRAQRAAWVVRSATALHPRVPAETLVQFALARRLALTLPPALGTSA